MNLCGDNEALNKMQEIIEKDLALIVLCGMSGTGKTTFAKLAMDKLQEPIKYFAIDDYKDRFYKKYGFCNKEERLIIRDLAIAEFKVDVMKEVNKGVCSVIIDYPFEKEWQPFFNFLKRNSLQADRPYKSVVVNFGDPLDIRIPLSPMKYFEKIWERRVERDTLLETRSASLVSKFYEMYADGSEGYSVDADKFSDDNKNRLWNKYKKGDFNAITGDFELSVSLDFLN